MKLFKETIGWGVFLWLFGYVLGIILFMVVPPSLLGWILMPIGTVLTIWVLLKKIKYSSLNQYLTLSIIWALLAIILDYVFLVKLLNPPDGYYKLDIYIYYTLTFLLPILVGLYKIKNKAKE